MFKVFLKFFSNFKIIKFKDNYEEVYKFFGENSCKVYDIEIIYVIL